ncbi:hypothetical protein ACIPUD_10550 [Bradyrhizobium sp. CAR08]
MIHTRIELVGGPADGETIERPKASTVNVPTLGGGSMAYTMRRCRDAGGKVVEVLAPAGREMIANGSSLAGSRTEATP